MAIITCCDRMGSLGSTAADQVHLSLAPDQLDEFATPKAEVDLFVLFEDVGVACICVFNRLVDVPFQDRSPNSYSKSVEIPATWGVRVRCLTLTIVSILIVSNVDTRYLCIGI